MPRSPFSCPSPLRSLQICCHRMRPGLYRAVGTPATRITGATTGSLAAGLAPRMPPLFPGPVNCDRCVAGPEKPLRKKGGEIVDLYIVIIVGVRAGDVGVELVSRIQHGNSLSMRILATLLSPSTQARRLIAVPTRGGRVVVILDNSSILRPTDSTHAR
ncbi:uncharacterized protein LOC119340735 [Triticum dicoccoides]|uniref:uncharacterized protein LOC119340735 n=1 Tax=Triticum dicoccoides TaxID=85692 RepID=UPI00189136B1|nr:uncharacterized protein LOC119340735 [Triticum dicoccoides]